MANRPTKNGASSVRCKPADEWGRVDRLYMKMLHWLYLRQRPEKALVHADHLAVLLAKVDPDEKCIFGQECRSLVCEARGDFCGAIRHRRKEIRFIRRLRKISRGKPYESVALSGYDYGDESDRLDLLAILYEAAGDREKAIRTLQESKRLCRRHGVEFDAQDVLDDYQSSQVTT